MNNDSIREAIVKQVLQRVNAECISLCRKTNMSQFRTIHSEKFVDFKWYNMVADLKKNAPLLFTLLDSITSRNDHRNTVKVGRVHYPGICSAAAILLKERNREMTGLQSLVSLILYSCHAEKQVNYIVVS